MGIGASTAVVGTGIATGEAAAAGTTFLGLSSAAWAGIGAVGALAGTAYSALNQPKISIPAVPAAPPAAAPATLANPAVGAAAAAQAAAARKAAAGGGGQAGADALGTELLGQPSTAKNSLLGVS